MSVEQWAGLYYDVKATLLCNDVHEVHTLLTVVLAYKTEFVTAFEVHTDIIIHLYCNMSVAGITSAHFETNNEKMALIEAYGRWHFHFGSNIRDAKQTFLIVSLQSLAL